MSKYISVNNIVKIISNTLLESDLYLSKKQAKKIALEQSFIVNTALVKAKEKEDYRGTLDLLYTKPENRINYLNEIVKEHTQDTLYLKDHVLDRIMFLSLFNESINYSLEAQSHDLLKLITKTANKENEFMQATREFISSYIKENKIDLCFCINEPDFEIFLLSINCPDTDFTFSDPQRLNKRLFYFLKKAHIFSTEEKELDENISIYKQKQKLTVIFSKETEYCRVGNFLKYLKFVNTNSTVCVIEKDSLTILNKGKQKQKIPEKLEFKTNGEIKYIELCCFTF